MTTQTKLGWDDLVAGQALGSYQLAQSQADVEEFQDVVDPRGDIYDESGWANLAYDTLHAVKQFVDLPQGTVHSKEAVAFHHPIDPSTECLVDVAVADRFTRRGRPGFVIENRITSGEEHCMTVYKTFVLPGTSEESDTQGNRAFDFGLFDMDLGEPDMPGIALESYEIPINQNLIDRFGKVTATDGPIHSDPAVATPIYGGTLLQAMYIFEIATQAMSRLSSVSRWSVSGKIAAKIVGSTISGESVTVAARVHEVVINEAARAMCSITATTNNGKTVFLARADAPLEAIRLIKDVRP
ncbi:hypothetical protein [Citricoccus sp. NR2]|uniref:hypothetical protein n=1 Tax=Citricoccus sp. NR2 TaxID=3004095 RepID=UPI0022DD4304|nr:hypothetical protein [Citricoccus sp. NR2]WBL19498.1 hypothetical protein O1A05_01965 [Citricoccus sp. NR2]